MIPNTIKPEWLEHLLDHGNLFKTWIVRAIEGESWRQVRKQMVMISGSLFDLLYYNFMLSLLIRIALMR